jgi:hypothetical protein
MHGRARRLLSLRACVVSVAALAWACGPTDVSNDPTDVHAEVSEHVVTVINVHWKTEKPSVGYVEYGPTRELGLTTPMGTEESTSHTQPLVGLKEDTTYYYRVVTWDEDAGQSEVKSARTGYLPPFLPTLELSIAGGHDQFVVTPVLGADRAIIIVDPDGQIVWYYRDEATEYEHYRARVSRDGKSVLYSATEMTPDPVEDSEVVRVSFDGSERTSIPIPYLAHDFVEHPDGTIAALVFEDRDGVRGNKIVEVDAEGNSEEIWTPWNCFDPVETPGDEPDISTGLGWTFTNALDYNSTAQVYYVSIRNFSSIARVSRSGECQWVLGFTASTIEFDSAAGRFQHQHQSHAFGDCDLPQSSPCNLLVMDNEGSLTPQESRILEYELDLETNIATERWRYVSDPPVYTWVLGEPQRLLGNDTFINWSTAGTMERVTQAGEVTWKLNSRLGAAFGFSALVENLYEP